MKKKTNNRDPLIRCPAKPMKLTDIRKNGNMVCPEDLPNAAPFREGKMLKQQQLLAGKA